MTISTALVTTSQPLGEDDMFADLEPISAIDVKKDYLATQLAALMSFCEKNRSELAHGLGWKKSRVTRVLSGKENLTVKTMWEFSSYLGFDFDVVFRHYDDRRPKQPWQIEQRGVASIPTARTQISDEHSHRIPSLVINIQQAHEVAHDLLTGNHKNIYFSICNSNEAATGTFAALGNQSQINPAPLWAAAVQIPIVSSIGS